MPPRSRRLRWAAALVLALACRTEYDIIATVRVPDDVAAAYSETDRGILLVRFDSGDSQSPLHEAAVICGEGGTFSATRSGDGAVPDTTVRAWIEPLTEDRPCGQLSGYIAVDVGQVIDEDEPQASATIEAPAGCEVHDADTELVLAWP